MTTLVYITAAGEDLIRVFELDSAGKLTHRQDLPVGGGPSALATSANWQFLYCSLRASRELAAFRFERDGGLHLLGKQSLDADTCYIAVDKTGRFLLAAYYGAGKATVHRLEADGSVGNLVCTVPTADRAHCIETDNSNQYALVPHPLDANCIVQFLFDEREGQLTFNPAAARVVAPDGAGPRHFVFSLDQRYVYTSDEDGSSVSAYHFNGAADGGAHLDPGSGTLRAFQTLSTLPDEFSGENTCAQIHLHPAGRTLYVSNRGHDSIAIFAVDSDNGTLTRMGWQETETVPRVFNIDPSGRFLVVAGQGSGRAASYAVDAHSGALSQLDVVEVGERPMWVLFKPHVQ